MTASHQLTSMLTTCALVVAAAAAAGCKAKQDEGTAPSAKVEEATPAPMAPPPGTGDTATPGATPGAQPGGGAADPELAVISITAVDIDTKLAAMCGIAESDVFFKYDSSKLRDDAKERLDKIVTCAREGAAKGKQLVAYGHTDPVGSDDFNKQLGMSRAESVAKYLQEQGLAAVRVEAASRGEAMASAHPLGWPSDRRVTLRLAP